MDTSKLTPEVVEAVKESERLLADSEQLLKQAERQRAADARTLERIRETADGAEKFLANVRRVSQNNPQ